MSDYNGSNTPIDIRDLWRTPPEIFAALNAEFSFIADAAASDINHLHPIYITAEQNALISPWPQLIPGSGYVWLNPPYSDIGPWVAKAADENKWASYGVVMLVPADVSVGWFRLALQSCGEVRFITGGRISFLRADTGQAVNGNNKGSMLLIWHPGRVPPARTTYADRDSMIAYGRNLLSAAEREVA